MKLVEKKCPNCGASIKFKKEDSEVECKYCHTTFTVERELDDNLKELSDELILRAKTIKKFHKGFMIIWALIFLFGLIMFFLIFFKVSSKMF